MRKNKVYFSKAEKPSDFPRTYVTFYTSPSCECGATVDDSKVLSVCGLCGTGAHAKFDKMVATKDL